MNKSRSLFLFFLICLVADHYEIVAQSGPEINVSNSTMISYKEDFPFWLQTNRHGKIAAAEGVINVTDFSAYRSSGRDKTSAPEWEWGVHLVGGIAETNYLQLNRAFAGVSYQGWQLKGGMFYEPRKFAGLSTTNGNLARSENARPYPRLQLSSKGYKPLPFAGDWLNFKAEYEEGVLNDKRYVKNARLHHKSFYLGINPGKEWKFRMGLEHYVMWGGTSRNKSYGRLPDDFGSYLKYIRGANGDEFFPESDRVNTAGNHFGTYQLEIEKILLSVKTVFYLSHFFEDYSGMNWRNWRDNLLGIHLNFKNTALITDLVYEYTDTRNQSVRDSLYFWSENQNKWIKEHTDDYYINIIYNSGITYHQLMMGSPVAGPLVVTDGIVTNIRSNRFYVHHLGARGNLFKFLQWKGLLTVMHHFGTYDNPYNPVQKQLSSLLEFVYASPGFSAEIGAAIAADMTNTAGKNAGFQLWLSKSW